MSGKQILLVEDQELVATNLRFMLKAHGHSIADWVLSGEDAIAKIGTINPDLVLMDIHLAGEMSGFEAAQIIQKQYNLPVVFLTAEANLKGNDRNAITEAYGYLLKPFSEGELRAVVAMAINRHRVEVELRDIRQRQQLAYELGHQLSALLEPTALLEETVNQLRDRLEYYHVHIYMLHKSNKEALMEDWMLVVKAGTGKAGAMMLEAGHKIPYMAERSLVARAARSRDPVAVNDVTLDPIHLPNQLLPETKAEVAIPVIAGERLIGVLDVQDTHVNHFDDNEISTLRLVSNQLAVALSNAEMFEKNKQYTEQLKTLREIDQAILAAQLPSDIAGAALNHIEKLFPCKSASVMMFNVEEQKSKLLAQRGTIDDTTLTPSLSIDGLDSEFDHLKTEKLIQVDKGSAMFRCMPLRTALDPQNTNSYYCVALLAQGELIGCLSIDIDKGAEFTEEHIKMAKDIADLLAVGLYQAHQRGVIEEAENRYHSLFDNIPIGVYRTTPSGKILDANPAMAEMLGYPSREDLIKINALHTYTTPEDRERWLEIVNKHGVVQDFEVRLRRYDGTIIWAKNSARAIYDDKGKILYFEGALVS